MERGVRFVHLTDNVNSVFMWFSFCRLSLHFWKEPHLLWKTPLQFWRQFQQGLSIVALSHGQIIGHITLWRLVDNWYESGSLWVRPDFRRHGIGRELKKRIMALGLPFNVLSTTTNEMVKKMNRDLSIEKISFWKLPFNVHRATCSCNSGKMRAADFRYCALKDKECRLFVARL